MKLRRTVYPVAVIIAIPLVIVVFMMMNQGHFEQAPFIVSGNDEMVEGYFIWKGFGSPTIKEVEPKGNEAGVAFISYNPTKKDIATSAPVSVAEKINQYHPVFSVKVDATDRPNVQQTPGLIVHYSIFGINRQQEIEWER